MKNPFGSQGPPGWLVTGGIASVALGYLILAFLPAQKSIGLLRRQLLDKDQHVAASQQLATTLAAANGQLDHPSRVFLVDPQGRIREIYNLNFLRVPWVVEDVQLLVNER